MTPCKLMNKMTKNLEIAVAVVDRVWRRRFDLLDLFVCAFNCACAPNFAVIPGKGCTPGAKMASR
jgi:hypothetical protein